MLRLVGILILAVFALPAANRKLYLKDGTYHIVREYKIVEDRVSFYSVERSQWEEIPLELADLERTEREAREGEESRRAEIEIVEQEEKLERQMRREGRMIPQEPGVYRLVEGKVVALKEAELKLSSSKGRSILKAITPIPIIAGKTSVEIDGVKSAAVIEGASPEFYIRLSALQRFGIFRLTPKKEVRLVETWNIVPVAEEVFEEREEVEVFRQQLDEALYKLWPMQPLPPGEYAVVEYTQGERNIQVWDFSLEAPPPAGGQAARAPGL